MIAPTLLIGLGGTGSKIVCKVAGLVSEEQRKHISFAVFDTDINELREIQAANPFIKTIQTSTKLTVGEYLNIDTHARDNWFPVNPILNSKTLTEGAGQVRAVSRLAFDTALRAGNLEPLHAAIEELYKIEESHADQALRIVIVSSLAGGTGSGLILPVALYTRHYLTTRFHQSANIARGFFILPEVFYKVIRGEAERNNLKCNAYATLRELDAFMMRGDGTLPEKYQNMLKLEFPRVASQDFEEYMIRPYDFCFLFDAQNTNDLNLNDFNQYLDHAANCIYAQSIGPMNKRSNSSEDNTIRKLCEERGRNRYAGAGCSMIVYPVNDVKEYVAMKWTSECISKEWRKFDDMYEDKLEHNKKMRESGHIVNDMNEEDYYVDAIERKALEKDPFACEIINECTRYDNDGQTPIGKSWDIYIASLKEFVDKSPLTNQDLVMSLYQKAAKSHREDELLKKKDKLANAIVDAYRDLQKYRDVVYKGVEDSAGNQAYAIFKAQNEQVTEDRQEHLLETWLRDSLGNFIHPNAVRYFLIKALKLMRDYKRAADNQADAMKRYMKEDGNDGFEHKYFDDPDTEKEETAKDLPNRKLSLPEKLGIRINKMPDMYHEIVDQFGVYLRNVDEYRKAAMQSKVFDEGIRYIEELCKSFANFYRSFKVKINAVSRRLSYIEKKYSNTNGRTTRYVCSSPECLNIFVKRVPYSGGFVSLDSELAADIYSKVREYAMLKTKPENGAGYFAEIFDSGIIGYFKKKIMQSYGGEIDMDIVTALEREAEFAGEIEPARQESYITKVIRDMRALSTPFIERPMGEQKAPIEACTYNPSIDPGDDSPRSMLLARELRNFGGTPDEDISIYEIMFYQSIYGLRANQLSKFSPAIPGTRPEGEYFKAYFEIVSQIVPKSEKTPVVTPHIDRNWHIVSVMPDLDEGNQKAQENNIYQAFLLYLLNYKRYPSERGNKNLYKLLLGDYNTEDFVVSNKTPCDNFYEILDALMINPVVVRNILTDATIKINREVSGSRKAVFKESRLYKRLNPLPLWEFSKKGGAEESSEYTFKVDDASLFDIACLLRLSTPSAEFQDSQGAVILKAMLDFMYDYMKRMTAETERDEVFGQFILDQYVKFANNKKHYAKGFNDYIGNLLRVAYAKLEEFELDDIYDEISSDAATRGWL